MGDRGGYRHARQKREDEGGQTESNREEVTAGRKDKGLEPRKETYKHDFDRYNKLK